MKVIMTGGGTGGHIYPAIAIADKIKERYKDAEILFVGTEKGLETKLVPENGYPIEYITVAGFNRKKPLKNIEVLRKISGRMWLSVQAGTCADLLYVLHIKPESNAILMSRMHSLELQIRFWKTMSIMYFWDSLRLQNISRNLRNILLQAIL